jgi:mRNA-degrading endonuclease RelE of RelBE toxin-antitoxin system
MVSQKELTEILLKEILKMLKNDFSNLQQLIDEILKTDPSSLGMNKKKLGESYYYVQRIQMELYRLVSLIS